ncbi:MAG: HAMP domain-containing protein [Undibacterium sp.]|nr:HAMP domain-containing protein [Opitutaceae bacterium]
MLALRPTFAAKLLFLLVGLVAAAQLATGLIVSRASLSEARTQITEDLRRATLSFTNIVNDRNTLLADSGTTAARDYAFKPLFVASDDTATLASALPSIALSTRADLVIALALDGHTLASAPAGDLPGGVLRQLIATAELDESPTPRATGYGYHRGELHSLVLVPVRAPEIVAWLVLGFRIDHRLTQRLHEQTGIDLTFADQDDRVIASSLAPDTARALLASPARPRRDSGLVSLPLAGEDALVIAYNLPAGEGHHATLYLQYSLDEKLRPAHRTQLLILGVSLGSLAIALYLGRRFARRLSQPIVELVGHTRRIARGDYAVRNTYYRRDEFGRLSEAVDQMSRGLDERDRVRDLLDKNVSPEIAARLLRDGATLGGEERQVTILFADLRGFTTLSEHLPAPELLALLNRYLDRMSAALEAHGGVIDKYIGDAIMALFGAPVSQGDDADRALAAALAMEKALATLNAELAAEGTAPLAIGIGINTARVVAGNIGSARRLNYSVIGDGVNIAARVEALTRNPEYRATIITTAATLAARRPPDLATPAPNYDSRSPFSLGPHPILLRPLGPVPVKGRTEPVEIFAVE